MGDRQKSQAKRRFKEVEQRCDTCKKNGTDERKGVVQSEKVRNRKEEVQKKKIKNTQQQKTKRARTLVSPCCVGSLRDACTATAIVSEDNDSLLFSWVLDVSSSSREG